MGTFNGDQVLNINTASFAFGSVVVVAIEVEVIVGETSEALRAQNLQLSGISGSISLRSRLFCTYGQFGSTRSGAPWEKASPMRSKIEYLIMKYLSSSIRIYDIKQVMVSHRK